MSNNAQITFGSSGIRGPYGETITPQLAHNLGQALSTLADTAVLAHDARKTAQPLEHALIAGLTSTGTDVHRLGLAPTPTLAHATQHHDIGVMITASHNPAPDNGFKLFTPNGAQLGSSNQQRIHDALENPPPLAAWNQQGTATHTPHRIDAYVDALKTESGPLEEHPRIVIDPGHGAASHVSPRLLREAGAQPITLNATPDGTFPARPSEPTPENLQALATITEHTDAILGVAHDGDGDRIAAVDETGRILTGDQTLVLLAKALHAEHLAVPEDTSRLVWDALPNATIDVTPVGDTYISQQLAESKGDFGGEPSGSMIFPKISLCPDGPHAALVLADLAAEHDGIANLVDELPTYATLRESVPCPENVKPAAMADIQNELSNLGQVHVLDGVRLETDDGWALVRPSGTEAKLRILAEAHEETEAQRILSLVQGIVDESLYEVQHA